MKAIEHWNGNYGSFGFTEVGSAARLLGITTDEVRTLVQKETIEAYPWVTGDIVLNTLHVDHLKLLPEVLNLLLRSDPA